MMIPLISVIQAKFGAIELLYPSFLLMIHHEETQLNANRNPNPKEGMKVQ